MSMYDLPEESELIVKSRKAAYCARQGRRRRLNGANLTAQDMDDMIQAAGLAYWKHQREGRPIPFCFVCARQAAEKYFYRKILGRNPRSPLSLDAPAHDGGDLPHEWLALSAPTGDDMVRLDWLSDDVLEGVLFDARLAAGYSKRRLIRFHDTLQTDDGAFAAASSAWPPMGTPTPASPSFWAPRKARSGTGGSAFAACWNTCSLGTPLSSTTARVATTRELVKSSLPIRAEKSQHRRDQRLPQLFPFATSRSQSQTGAGFFFVVRFSTTRTHPSFPRYIEKIRPYVYPWRGTGKAQPGLSTAVCTACRFLDSLRE